MGCMSANDIKPFIFYPNTDRVISSFPKLPLLFGSNSFMFVYSIMCKHIMKA